MPRLAAPTVQLKILDPRLPGWGFPHYGSRAAAGLDLHACIDEPLLLRPQAPAVLIPAGVAFRIGDPAWCALVLPRSGLGHREGLVLGNAVGLIDADYAGQLLISAWNRNPPHPGAADEAIRITPGDRIAQLVFTRVARPEFAFVTEFGESGGRQAGGFGSTGVAAEQRGLVQTGRGGETAASQGEMPRHDDDPADEEAPVRDRGGARHRV